jgi:hypothetical protein
MSKYTPYFGHHSCMPAARERTRELGARSIRSRALAIAPDIYIPTQQQLSPAAVGSEISR